jgi:hypothetical protein
MRMTVWAGVVAALLVAASPAAAQTVARTNDRMFIGATGGASAVQNVGGVFGGEFGYRVSPRLDIVAEGLGFTDITTRRRIEAAETIAAVIQASQGAPATGTLKSPTFLAVGGVRIAVYSSGGVRVYLEGTGGLARVTTNPTFTLAGADITKQLLQFGVALGTDLTGTTSHGAFGGAFGVDVKQGKWYFGGHFGVTNVQTPSQASKVLQAAATIGRWF